MIAFADGVGALDAAAGVTGSRQGMRGPAKLPFRPQPANQAWLQPYMTPVPIPSKLMSDKAPVFPQAKPGQWVGKNTTVVGRQQKQETEQGPG